MSEQVKVVCRGTAQSGPHRERRLARYEWSASDDVWERVDQHGSDRDWYLGRDETGALVGYPTPRFKCPCGRDEQPRHEDLQERLRLAQATGKLVL